MPVICSRVTRLRSSIRFWSRPNSGPILATTTAMQAPSRITAATMIQDSPTSARSAITTPAIMVIGAPTMIARVMKTSICTCWTSLVVSVMSEGAPNLLTSLEEKDSVLVKTASRMSRPIPIETIAAK
jgi:hypothetical protein